MKYIALITSILFIQSCIKYPANQPVIDNYPITEYTALSAVLNGRLTGSNVEFNIIAKGHCWSSSNDVPDYRINQGKNIIANGQNGDFTSIADSLYPNTTYYVRAFYITAKDTVYAKQIQFFTTKDTTLQLPPNVATLSDSAISSNSFYINGDVVNIGSSSVTEYGHCYSSSNLTPTILDSFTNFGSLTAPTKYVSYLTNLSPNKTYHVRAYAKNAQGVAYGNVVHVTTSNANLVPILQFLNFYYNPNEYKLIFYSKVTDIGNSNIINYGHVFSSTNMIPIKGIDSTITTTAIMSSPDTFSNQYFSLNLNSILEPMTTYYMRAFATNGSGIGYSQVNTIKTDIAKKSVLEKYNSDFITKNGGIAVIYNNEIYMGLGRNATGNLTTQWMKYNPTTKVFSSLQSFPSGGLFGSAAFNYGSDIYVIGGEYDNINNQTLGNKNVYKYNITSNTWSIYDTAGITKTNCASFIKNDKIYMIGGEEPFMTYYITMTKDIKVYNISSKSVISKTDFPGAQRSAFSYFLIDNKFYCGGGSNYKINNFYNDFYEYDILSDSWTSKANIDNYYHNSKIANAACTSLDGKGYIIQGLLENGNPNNTIMRYNPANNTWESFYYEYNPNYNFNNGWAVAFENT